MVKICPRLKFIMVTLDIGCPALKLLLSNIPDPDKPEALEPYLTESPRIRREPRCEFRWAHSEYLMRFFYFIIFILYKLCPIYRPFYWLQ